jgi:hypothetical protein
MKLKEFITEYRKTFNGEFKVTLKDGTVYQSKGWQNENKKDNSCN